MQGRSDVRHGALGKFFSLHLGHGADYIALLYRAVADDHEFVQLVGILAHLYIGLAILDGDFLRTVSHV